MAITNNGTKNSLPADQIPSGYTRPTITTFTDWEYQRTLTLSVLKSTVENATNSTTMTNIFDDAVVGLDAQIEAIVAADYLATATVTTYADLRGLTTNVSDTNDGNGIWLDDTAVSYIATVILYVKVA
jgi:N-acetylglucosamine kinase-like BadF-type ATPase